MQRLTLILSDLYLPTLTRKEVSVDTVELPNLEWLLRFAHGVEQIVDWRSYLARVVGRTDLAALPLATMLVNNPEAEAETQTWVATPVHMEPRLDHLRLGRQGILQLAPDEACELRARFTKEFGPELRLLDAGNYGFVLEGLRALAVSTVDPLRVLGDDVGPHLPAGPGATTLRKLGSELELWLHREPLNDRRVRAGAAPVSSLWLWGGQTHEQVAPVSSKAVPFSRRTANDLGAVYFGDDSFVRALAAAVNAPAPLATPRDFRMLSECKAPTILLSVLGAGHEAESLLAIDRDWFAPARAALSEGALAELVIVANDRVLTVRGVARWRFWRTPRPWFEALTA